ncbi:MAG: NAD+ synthase [Hydrogenophaga sp.]|uniref:NAD+ synthase n=1 Tax=Hydrogenophaga sp. TaxID=1904254 RepID=UPI0027318012|nr:NAD+ synthase [Hydrogenophaga sp.]MDP2407990.1 NAD+ synthase [Hydrogenophaga sp.]MDZ4174956.1 NAD+ synthase [Hydrogenophaga sp.]
MTLKICVAQLNFVVGDMAGNARKIIDAAHDAHARGVGLLLTPELALCGYAAEDLFLRPAFIDACDDALKTVAGETAALKGLHIVVGHPVRVPGLAGEERRERSVSVAGLYNAASVLCDGQVVHRYAKRELPNYQVFDERRYFVPGDEVGVFDVTDAEGERVRVGLLICEDAWFDAPAAEARAAGAELLAVINASPFHTGKGNEREGTMRERVQATGVPLVYAHLVGGQDEIVFEGRSFVLGADGSLAGRAISFEEALFDIAFSRDPAGWRIEAMTDRAHSLEADLWHALVLGVRDYLGKNGFPGAILGLSGGIDSALVLAIAVDALGKDRVRTVMMPSPYTADISWIDARDMAARLGVRYDEIAIAPQFEAFKASLAKEFAGLPEDTTEENLQARIRGTLLMALSNKFGSIVLTTGNKSEMATGYCTLYGDMAGGFAVIKDVAKTIVFRLARWRNLHDPYGTGANPIPDRIITRPPSAELRADQKDQDSLPEYGVLDAIIERYMENDQSPASIVADGFDRADVDKVVRLIRINEYKRRQAPVGIRVTHRSFGKDWRYPITSKYRA